MVSDTLTSCPECEADVPTDGGIRLGEIVQCGDCAVELEVLTVSPVTLTLAPEVEDDWGE